MKLKTKSQITIIMVIGLVIFIVVGLVLYISKSVVKKTSQQNVKNTQETAIESQPIREFVQKCLDKTAKDGIVLLGKQGGFIYTSEGGPLHDPGDGFAVLCNIDDCKGLKASYNILQSFMSIPDYPWITFPYPDEYSSNKIFDCSQLGKSCGINAMPLLESSEVQSIQKQIQSYVDNNLAKCANFDVFNAQGLEVTMNNPISNVIFGSSDVTIKTKINLSITNPTVNEHTQIDEISTNVNIRLKDLYFFTKSLIQKDVDDLGFNMANPLNNKNSFVVNVLKHVDSTNSDLIVVTDQDSLINNEKFKYIFARENRPPALYYIKNPSVHVSSNFVTKNDILQGQELKAEDPDEDDLAYQIYFDDTNDLAQFPKNFDSVNQLKFRLEVNDGALRDYQYIIAQKS